MPTPTSPFQFDQAEDSPGFLLWQLTNCWQRELKKTLTPLQLTHAQFVLLASLQWLSYQYAAVTQVQIAGHAHMDPMTASTVLRTLQQRGLVQRTEHHADSRAKMVVLTPAGQALTAQAVPLVEAFDATFFRRLGANEVLFKQAIQQLLAQAPS